MATIEFPAPIRRTLAARARHRTGRAVRRGAPELRTLIKFTLVGGSGYVVNLLFFALATSLGAHHVVAAILAFLAAVGNNFHWNRRWTFSAVGAEAIHRQARRFLVVSTTSFFLSLGILELLVQSGLSPLTSQAISIAVATPVGFVGNRVWTFAERGSLRRHARRHRQRRAERHRVEALETPQG
jgi:putative flippase GtrA